MTTTALTPEELVASAPPSPAGPITIEAMQALRTPPAINLPKPMQVIWFGQFQSDFVFRMRRRYGDVYSGHGYVRGRPVLTSHPDHVRSIFTADPALVPTLAEESPLRPVLGPDSVLTANGPRHLRQRKLLLPPFHGEAIERYTDMIRNAAEREIASWEDGKAMSLAPRMQAITLDVILAGIFGIEGRPQRGSAEGNLRRVIRTLLWASTLPGNKLAELMNLGRDTPFGLNWLALLIPDRCLYAVIRERRRATDLDERTDILSMLLRATTEDGRELTDNELRDELITLVLAGHETTANQLAWTWERLVRNPAAYDRLRDAVRSDTDAAEYIEAVTTESHRSRPVIPMTGRRVKAPWQLGEFGVPADTAVAISILLLHHRHDLYPEPHAFLPERWLGRKPGTYEWLPFGGGTRRCLGATLALAEERVVLETMVRHLDLEATSARPERRVHRNVTMIPARGGRVLVHRRK